MKNTNVCFVSAAVLFALIAGCGGPVEEPPDDEGLPAPAESARALPVPLQGEIAVAPPAVPPDEEEPPPAEEEPPPAEEEPPVEEPPPEEEEPPVEEPPVVEPPPATTLPDIADCPRVKVVDTGGVVLNVRPDPSTAGDPVATLAPGVYADVIDIVTGQSISGDTSWFEIERGAVTGFVSGAFTQCAAASTYDDDDYLLPVGCGVEVKVTQGNNTSFSHKNNSAYAFDFGLALNTPLKAMQRGTVIAKKESTQPGDDCYSGGDSSCIGEANYVTLKHPDGKTTLYAHVNSVSVSVGQTVTRGQTVALSGGTGYSTGPHAHVARQTNCGYAICQSIAMTFADVDGDGVPVSGEWVESGNCP